MASSDIYGQLFQAWRAFRPGKPPTWSIDTFAYDLEANLADLAQDISEQTYRHGPYRHIVVAEKKRRDLAVAEVRDRVVHRLLYDDLVARLDAQLDPDVWSCRIGKGLHAGLRRTQQLLRRHPQAFIWRLDITKFFDSINQAVLLQILARQPLNSQIFRLCQAVIVSYSSDPEQPGVGMPIGNLTSQIFANLYLHEFDRFVRHHLKPLAYLRYGDDCLLFCPTRRAAFCSRRLATQFLHDQLKLTLNPKNNVIVPASQGLHFLGHAITANYAVVDRHTTRSVQRKAKLTNLASYKSLRLAKWPKRQLDWQVLDEITEIIDGWH